jgi:hypothetical protein
MKKENKKENNEEDNEVQVVKKANQNKLMGKKKKI